MPSPAVDQIRWAWEPSCRSRVCKVCRVCTACPASLGSSKWVCPASRGSWGTWWAGSTIRMRRMIPIRCSNSSSRACSRANRRARPSRVIRLVSEVVSCSTGSTSSSSYSWRAVHRLYTYILRNNVLWTLVFLSFSMQLVEFSKLSNYPSRLYKCRYYRS